MPPAGAAGGILTIEAAPYLRRRFAGGGRFFDFGRLPPEGLLPDGRLPEPDFACPEDDAPDVAGSAAPVASPSPFAESAAAVGGVGFAGFVVPVLRRAPWLEPAGRVVVVRPPVVATATWPCPRVCARTARARICA